MSHGSYKTPIAFKTAIEQRLRNATRDGGHLERMRQLLVFDRFLARVVHELGEAVVLKGGLVLEIRLQRARTTKDIDLRFSGDPTQLLDRLQRAAALDLGDYMTFEVAHTSIQRSRAMESNTMEYASAPNAKLPERLTGGHLESTWASVIPWSVNPT